MAYFDNAATTYPSQNVYIPIWMNFIVIMG